MQRSCRRDSGRADLVKTNVDEFDSFPRLGDPLRTLSEQTDCFEQLGVKTFRHTCTGQDRIRQIRTEQVRTAQVRTGQVAIFQLRINQHRREQVCTAQVRFVHSRIA